MHEANKQRVWIELERPVLVDRASKSRNRAEKEAVENGNAVFTREEKRQLMQLRAMMLSRMLRRLGVEGEDRIFVHEEKDVLYYAALDSSKMMTVLNDNGQWFNLGYLGREE